MKPAAVPRRRIRKKRAERNWQGARRALFPVSIKCFMLRLRSDVTAEVLETGRSCSSPAGGRAPDSPG